VGAAHGLSTRETAAWTGLLRAHAKLVRELDRELRAEHGLPLVSYLVLSEVAATPGGRIRMGELAKRASLTPAGLSGIVDRLERAGLVDRRPCDGDARGTYAAITARGKRTFRRAWDTHATAVRRRYTSRLADAELDVVAAVWQRVARAP
jgi:DNA-binding MarR family transcriptional regulator